MTHAEHRKRHKQLHAALDELAADWVAHQPLGKLFSNSSIMELIEWSYQQTLNPQKGEGYHSLGQPVLEL